MYAFQIIKIQLQTRQSIDIIVTRPLSCSNTANLKFHHLNGKKAIHVNMSRKKIGFTYLIPDHEILEACRELLSDLE